MQQKKPHCPICLEAYDLSNRLPKVLPCGHSTCIYCLNQIFKGIRLRCPFDRIQFETQLKEAKAFPTNFGLTTLIEDNLKKPKIIKKKREELISAKNEEISRLVEEIRGNLKEFSNKDIEVQHEILFKLLEKRMGFQYDNLFQIAEREIEMSFESIKRQVIMTLTDLAVLKISEILNYIENQIILRTKITEAIKRIEEQFIEEQINDIDCFLEKETAFQQRILLKLMKNKICNLIPATRKRVEISNVLTDLRVLKVKEILENIKDPTLLKLKIIEAEEFLKHQSNINTPSQRNKFTSLKSSNRL